MARLSLSDLVEMLLAQAESDRKEREKLTALVADQLAALTENRRASAAESVTVKRVGTGEKVTAAEVVAVVQPGETLEQATARAAAIYEVLAARYPLPSGHAHLAALGSEDELEAWRATLDAANGAGLHAVPDPEPKK